MHYFKKNIGDYAKKTGRLSMLQHGAYTLLIDSCYDREQFPTMDEAIEWTWASTTEEIEAVQFVLRKFFTLEEGVYVQKRIKEEIAEYYEKSVTNKRIAMEREAKRRENSTKRALVVHEAPPNQEPRTTNQEPLQEQTHVAPSAPRADVETVFECWKQAMKSPRSLLDAKRTVLIKKSLKTGYTPEQLCEAIAGCAKSEWHMGKNDRGTKFNGLDLILRNAENIDKFIMMASEEQRPGVAPRVYHDISGMDYTKGVDEHGRF